MKFTPTTITAFLFAIASQAAHAQNQAAFDPFSRTGLITPDQLINENSTQQNQQNKLPTVVKPNIIASSQTQQEKKAKQASTLSPEQQKILDKYNSKEPQTQMPSQPAPANQSLTNKTTIKSPSVLPSQPRYIQAPPSNVESLDYFTNKGIDKANHYGNTYLAPATTLPTSVSNTKQLELLEPTISELRNQGHDVSKITLELNRLTPAQFMQWAKEIRQ
jgi:hypothetical protein